MDSYNYALSFVIQLPYKITGGLYHFFTTPLGLEVVGAFIGIYFAYALIEFFQERKEVAQQIRNINSARSCGLSFFQQLVGYKSAHAYPMRLGFLLFKRNVIQQARQGTVIRVPGYTFNHINEADIDISDLRYTVLGRLDNPGRSLYYFFELSRTIAAVNTTKALINQFHKEYSRDTELFLSLFKPTPLGGVIDARYPGCVRDFYLLTNKAIYLCKLLLEELGDIGCEYENDAHSREPKIGVINFNSNPSITKLIPHDARFSPYKQRITRSKGSQV